MSDPLGIEMQRAFTAAMEADAALSALVGDRIYDRVPSAAAFPYVAFGDYQEQPDKADCIDGRECHLTLHVWSRAVGAAEAKRILAALNDLFDGNEALEIGGQTVAAIELESSIASADPDGLTTHGVAIFRLLTEPH